MDFPNTDFEEVFYDDEDEEKIEYGDDIEDEIDTEQNKEKKQDDTKYVFYGKKIKYDKKTMEYYRILRQNWICPLSKKLYDTKNVKYAFKFYDSWDPYTGERTGKDPYGPLYFDPITLCHYYYLKRLEHLWIDELDDGEEGGYFQGTYGDGVGIGKNFTIKSRGSHPERYLFRLPIPDCYLTDDHNNQIPTFGPLLTDLEVKDLNILLQRQSKDYISSFCKGYEYFDCEFTRPPNMILMKQYYDTAVNDNITVPKQSFLSKSQLSIARYKLNCLGVDMLRKM